MQILCQSSGSAHSVDFPLPTGEKPGMVPLSFEQRVHGIQFL